MSAQADRGRPPELGPPPVPHVPDVARGRFDNGLEWLHVERRDLPLVDVSIVVPAGGVRDPAHASGLTALTAEALEEGTLTRTGYEVADAVDRLGATLRIRPGWDATTVALHVLSERLPEALALAADVIRNATFPEAEVRRRREERVAALLQDRDEPAALAARAIVRSVYGDHPYGRSPAGTRESVAALERDDLQALHRARYRPHGAFVVSVGDIGAAELERVLADELGGWTGTAPEDPGPPEAPGMDTGVALVDRPGAPQSELGIGTVGPPRRTSDYAALLVLNTVLGGAFTSRLNLKLREEKGFTYGARSSFAFRRHGGPFVVSTAVGTANTAEAVEDALREIRRLADEPIPDEELARARRYLALGLPRRLETGSAMAAQLADLHLHGYGESELVEVLERVAAVTAADVQAAAHRWLDPHRMAVVVVGDAARVRASLDRLGQPVHDHTVVI